jgi:hypothetical protein
MGGDEGWMRTCLIGMDIWVMVTVMERFLTEEVLVFGGPLLNLKSTCGILLVHLCLLLL